MEEDLSRFCCQHPECPDYGQRGHGNLTVCGHYGKAQQHRLLYCRTCKARFSERKGTPLFRSGLAAGEGPRTWSSTSPTATGSGPPRGWSACTATRWSATADCLGEHAQQLHDELVAFSPSDSRGPARREVVLRLQEAGALRPRPTRPMTSTGDWWDHVAYDPEHKLVLCVVPGARAPRRPRPWSPTSTVGRRAAPLS